MKTDKETLSLGCSSLQMCRASKWKNAAAVSSAASQDQKNVRSVFPKDPSQAGSSPVEQLSTGVCHPGKRQQADGDLPPVSLKHRQLFVNGCDLIRRRRKSTPGRIHQPLPAALPGSLQQQQVSLINLLPTTPPPALPHSNHHLFVI